MDAACGCIGRQCRALVAQHAEHVEQPPQHGITHRHHDRLACGVHLGAARQARSGLHRDAADGGGVDVAVYFENQGFLAVPIHDQGRVYRGKCAAGEVYVYDGASDLGDNSRRQGWGDEAIPPAPSFGLLTGEAATFTALAPVMPSRAGRHRPG